ncbi:MAG: TlpA family protein disulfide reductase [Candidatus Nanopelagicales bacterium]
MTGFYLVLAILISATAFGLWYRANNGRIRTADMRTAGADEHGGETLDAQTIGVALGTRATFVQFSSAFCQPCRATRQILGEVSGMVEGVAHVDFDAEANLELVRALDIRRTPTVLVLDSAGRIRKRASGLPRKADVIAALGDLD